MNDNETMKYHVTIKFEHEEFGTTVRKFKIDDAAPWTDHLREYVDILGQVYGYSIADKVAAGGMVLGLWISDGRPTFDHTEGKVFKHGDDGYGDVPGFRRNNQGF
jgi:hypothetical protein